jgi:hypothetical protein
VNFAEFRLCELRRIPIPRTTVNKGKKKGRVPLQKHSDRCGCRESYLGSYGKSHKPGPPMLRQMRPRQQSSSAVQAWFSLAQHLPFSQGSPLQHGSSAAQEPPTCRHVRQVLVVRNGVQILLQQSLSAVQVPLFGMHIGVVVDVEVVLVEVVGVVVEVLVEVLVVVVVVGAAVVVVVGLSHGPRRSPWPRWPSTALLGTSLVCSAGVPGLWQMVTFCC